MTMMAIIKQTILLALVILMVGCRYRATGMNIETASNSVVVVDENTSDSCEYYPHYGHKGNCRFCKERRQKELKKLIEQLKEK